MATNQHRLVSFLVPRLIGTDLEKETALEMIQASLNEAHSEGLQDAIYVLQGCANAITAGPRKEVLEVMVKALTDLQIMNARDEAASQS